MTQDANDLAMMGVKQMGKMQQHQMIPSSATGGAIDMVNLAQIENAIDTLLAQWAASSD